MLLTRRSIAKLARVPAPRCWQTKLLAPRCLALSASRRLALRRPRWSNRFRSVVSSYSQLSGAQTLLSLRDSNNDNAMVTVFVTLQFNPNDIMLYIHSTAQIRLIPDHMRHQCHNQRLQIEKQTVRFLTLTGLLSIGMFRPKVLRPRRPRPTRPAVPQ